MHPTRLFSNGNIGYNSYLYSGGYDSWFIRPDELCLYAMQVYANQLPWVVKFHI